VKAFDLQKALEGEAVTTRSGNKVTQVHLFNLPTPHNKEQCLYAVIDGVSVSNFYTNGVYLPCKKDSDYDLFMS